MKKKIVITVIITVLILIVVFVGFSKFLMDQVSLMGDNQRLSKEENYTELSKDSVENSTIFFGDSITEYCPLNEVYADYINQTGSIFINRGISGETTRSMLDRIESNVISLKPNNLVMLMGINDLGEGVQEEQILDNVSTMIDLVKAQSPQTNIILEAVYPINTSDRAFVYENVQIGNRTNEMIQSLNKQLETLAKQKEVQFLNVNELLEDENGELKKEYTTDGLHLTIEGYLAIKEKIVECLR